MELGPEILNEVGALSYAGVFLLSLLANFVVPIPEEITLLALGYLVGTGIFKGYLIIPIVIAGLLISDIVLFILAKRGSRIVTYFYEKFFAKRIAKRGGARWTNRHIGKIIVISRFLVQFRFLGPFLAGHRKIPIGKFIRYELLALIIYVPLYILLGAFFHNKVRYIITKVDVLRNIILIAIVVIIVIAVFKFIYRFFFKKDVEIDAPTP
jgi:membrane protein DedA with SNARE-associated domain